MANQYDANAATALRLIKKKGEKMVLVRLGILTYDPLNPDTSGPTIELHSETVGITLPETRTTGLSYDSVTEHNPEHAQDFRSIYIAASPLTFQPITQDVLSAASGAYRIIGITPLCPDGVTHILYRMRVTLEIQIDVTTVLATLPP